MSKMQSHNHYQNQTGWNQPMGKPSPSAHGQVGVTPPLQGGSGKRAVSSPSDTAVQGGIASRPIKSGGGK